MEEAITIGLDIAKHVFHAHGADERGRALFSKRISRGKVLEFFAAKPPCVVALEACGEMWAPILYVGKDCFNGDPETCSVFSVLDGDRHAPWRGVHRHGAQSVAQGLFPQVRSQGFRGNAPTHPDGCPSGGWAALY